MHSGPPSFFNQGPPAWVRLLVLSLLSLALILVDGRFRALDSVREGISVALYPFQQVMLLPRDALRSTVAYFNVKTDVQKELEQLHIQRIEAAQLTSQAAQLAAENTQLRKLLGATERVPAPAVLVEILYEVRDAFSRRLVLDKGRYHQVRPGMPVIDDGGVVGQVVRATPTSAEVSLVNDKHMTVPVQILRNGLRAVTQGGEPAGRISLRYMASDADIQVGDQVVTSGLDGIYPAGLPVAVVESVEIDGPSGLARILCKPVAALDQYRHFLVLQTVQEAPTAEPEPVASKEAPAS
ncbi:MAG: rod shape-determining protein MreC [Pigmentiphaga sp.]|nr:rod shape-determining protein MreC [Pigmentiphaga sp.]